MTMNETSELQADPGGVINLDRRRAGRQDVASELVPLLRTPALGDELSEDLRHLLDNAESVEDDGDWTPRDPIAPARGVALAVGLCVPVWGVIGGLLYMMLR
ncbi:hypothetical protein [Acidisphaera sp. L21]|uniref:hypothetical protein n=1 Tax=Acidisphaera sp. L21 TaxID=1641851 RepID=UPI00131E2D60|nr:hypothetical protein [Acidisphaera sp. L21]